MADKSPILLLHGAWHGAWCWEPVATELAGLGHPTLAIDLPGHGLRATVPGAYDSQDETALATADSACASLGVPEVTAPALDSVRALAAAHGPVVVVGHSLAGVCLNYLGEQAPEAVKRLVYLAALAPAPGRTVFEDASTPHFADSLFLALPISDPAATGAVRINWASADASYAAMAQECFYGDVPASTRAIATRFLTPDAPARLYSETVEMTADRWGSLPRTWLRCTQDRAVPIAAQDANIAALDQHFPEHAFETTTLEYGHSPMLAAPDALATAIASSAG